MCFFNLLVISVSYNFGGHFKNTYPPISLEYQPLEAMRPSFLAFEPFLTYTLIGPWCKSTLKMFLIAFLELLFLKNCVMSRGLWWSLSPLLGCFMVFIFLFITSMGSMWNGWFYGGRMSMWFWMNKAIMIGIDQIILLAWILNYYCLDHGEVIWDSSKKENMEREKGEDETQSFREE